MEQVIEMNALPDGFAKTAEEIATYKKSLEQIPGLSSGDRISLIVAFRNSADGGIFQQMKDAVRFPKDEPACLLTRPLDVLVF